MRESGAEGSEGRGKLRDERHSHVNRERERRAENEAARVTGPNSSIRTFNMSP